MIFLTIYIKIRFIQNNAGILFEIVPSEAVNDLHSYF